MYVTPRRIRNMGLGLDLSTFSDVELREQLETAQSDVDAFCNVPTVPQPYSFKGGEVIDEEHGWGRNNQNTRVYPYHTPLKAVSDFRILATESLFITFNEAGDLFVAKHEGYIEIINLMLSKIGIWGNANIPQMGLIDPVARMSYTYGYDYRAVDDELMPIDTVSGEEADTVFMAANGYWSDEEVTVKVDGTEVDVGDYELNRSTGLVTFDSPQTNVEATASYHYRIPREVVRASALTAVSLIGESKLVAKGLTGIESIEIEEVRIRRIGSRSGAEKGVDLPISAQNLLMGYRFITVRGSDR